MALEELGWDDQSQYGPQGVGDPKKVGKSVLVGEGQRLSHTMRRVGTSPHYPPFTDHFSVTVVTFWEKKS